MNFDEAIKAHSDWKLKLSSYLKKPDGSIDSVKLSKDDQCALGQWLHGEGKKYNSNEHFKELVDCHKHFHTAAADVVNKANSGTNVSEEIALGASSPFAKHSSSVVGLIMKMKRELS